MYNPDSLNTIVVAGPQGPPLADIHDSFGRTGSEAIPYRTLIPLILRAAIPTTTVLSCV